MEEVIKLGQGSLELPSYHWQFGRTTPWSVKIDRFNTVFASLTAPKVMRHVRNHKAKELRHFLVMS